MLCSAGNGGAFNVYGDSNTLTVTNISSSLLANNSAVHGGGGALALTGGISFVNGNTFKNNNATQYGASIQYQAQCSNLFTDFGKLTSINRFFCSKGPACTL